MQSVEVPETTFRLDPSLERLTRLGEKTKKFVLLRVTVYYSSRTQVEISTKQRHLGRRLGQTRHEHPGSCCGGVMWTALHSPSNHGLPHTRNTANRSFGAHFSLGLSHTDVSDCPRGRPWAAAPPEVKLPSVAQAPPSTKSHHWHRSPGWPRSPGQQRHSYQVGPSKGSEVTFQEQRTKLSLHTMKRTSPNVPGVGGLLSV